MGILALLREVTFWHIGSNPSYSQNLLVCSTGPLSLCPLPPQQFLGHLVHPFLTGRTESSKIVKPDYTQEIPAFCSHYLDCEKKVHFRKSRQGWETDSDIFQQSLAKRRRHLLLWKDWTLSLPRQQEYECALNAASTSRIALLALDKDIACILCTILLLILSPAKSSPWTSLLDIKLLLPRATYPKRLLSQFGSQAGPFPSCNILLRMDQAHWEPFSYTRMWDDTSSLSLPCWHTTGV